MDVAIAELIGKPALDKEHKKVGKISHFYLDATDSYPTWVAVTTGLFGNKETLAPLALAEITDAREVVIDADKKTIKDAPSLHPGEELTAKEQARLYQHYKSIVEQRLQEGHRSAHYEHEQAAASDRTGMTRAEEERKAKDDERNARERMRLKKYTETEDTIMTVPLAEESAWLEREPTAYENGKRDKTHDEPPIVEKRTVVKEQVRLTKGTGAQEETMSDHTVHKEQIDREHK